MSTFQDYLPPQRFEPVLALSPDGTQVVYSSSASGQYNLWRHPLDGGEREQLTHYTDQSVREVTWSPDGTQLLYAADRDGDEFQQIYLMPATGGPAEQLTDASGVRHYLAMGGAFSPDGRLIAYCGNDRDPAEQDVLLRDVATGEVRRVQVPGGLPFPGGFSPDGRQLTIMQGLSNTDCNIYLLSLDEDGTLTHLTPHEGEELHMPGPWASDGSGFWALTNADREAEAMVFQGTKPHTATPVVEQEWGVETVLYARDANLLVWTVNEDGYSTLHARDLTSGEPVQLPSVPRGVISALGVSRDGRLLAFLLESGARPTEVAILDRVAGTFRYLTDSRPTGLESLDCREPELVRYTTHDGRQIPAFLYRPAGDGPFPVVLSIHGGPEYQERPSYNYGGMYQYLLSMGVAVLAPNVRGSTGYGRSYQMLIHRDWGGAELRDFEYAVSYLRGLDWVDPDRIGVFGGSFGGFATLSCISRLPDLWRAAVSIVGPSNLVTFAKAVPPTWRPMLAKWVGDPDTEADFLMERSPITYADAIHTPLFVIQGAKDPRVVKTESDQIVERLRSRGVDVRYDVYEDEGHGFTRRENELRALGDTADFLASHLNAASGGSTGD